MWILMSVDSITAETKPPILRFWSKPRAQKREKGSALRSRIFHFTSTAEMTKAYHWLCSYGVTQEGSQEYITLAMREAAEKMKKLRLKDQPYLNN